MPWVSILSAFLEWMTGIMSFYRSIFCLFFFFSSDTGEVRLKIDEQKYLYENYFIQVDRPFIRNKLSFRSLTLYNYHEFNLHYITNIFILRIVILLVLLSLYYIIVPSLHTFVINF